MVGIYWLAETGQKDIKKDKQPYQGYTKKAF